MLSLGALAFLQPLFLIGLVALPILWWLLRAVPPAPRRERFPGVRVLLGLEDKERTPQRTPWWLLLLRMIAAALLLFAFAQPLLNPQTRLTGEGPLLLVLDGGWASAGDWAERRGFALDLLAQAEQSDRPTALVNLANPNAGTPDAPARIALLP
ncbi:MAG: BatA domain-containing protein, partial [Pseudomonadota bacterium]